MDASAKPVRIWLPYLYANPDPPGTASRTPATSSSTRATRVASDLWAEGPRDLTVDRVRGEVYVKANGNHNPIASTTRPATIKDVIDVSRLAPGRSWPRSSSPARTATSTSSPGTRACGGSTAQGKPTQLGRPEHAQHPDRRHDVFSAAPSGPASPTRRPTRSTSIATADYLTKNPKDAGNSSRSNAIGQDGKTKRTVIWQCLNGAIPRLDAKGNIYLADLVKPPDRSYPEFFDGKLPAPPKQTRRRRPVLVQLHVRQHHQVPADRRHHLAPEGPAQKLPWASRRPTCWPSPSSRSRRHFATQPHLTGEIQGALWTRFGYAPYSAHMSGNTSHCMCEGSGFDVDPFGRVFFPNLGQFRIEVVDTNNNPITTFGKYGNEDSGGPSARVKKPDIPLAWPVYVAVSDRCAYVADTVNRRVVRVKLAYAAEATCAVP